MRFDSERAKNCFERNDTKELIKLGYHLYTNSTYVDSHEYADLVDLINTILDYIYGMENREVQEAFIMMLHNAVNCHSATCPEMKLCLDKMERIITSGKLNDWELAETLLIISCTMDEKYTKLMTYYKDYEDPYVQEVVKEYFYDLTLSGKMKGIYG